MKNHTFLAYALFLCVALTGCASFLNEGQPTAAPADSNKIVQVAQTFTNDIFTAEQPAITTAVAHLPPETQALAQAAMAALQKGIDAAVAKGVTNLSTADQAKAQAALVALGEATDKLSAVLHTPGDPVLTTAPASPNLILPGTPNATVAPTVNVTLP